MVKRFSARGDFFLVFWFFEAIFFLYPDQNKSQTRICVLKDTLCREVERFSTEEIPLSVYIC